MEKWWYRFFYDKGFQDGEKNVTPMSKPAGMPLYVFDEIKMAYMGGYNEAQEDHLEIGLDGGWN